MKIRQWLYKSLFASFVDDEIKEAIDELQDEIDDVKDDVTRVDEDSGNSISTLEDDVKFLQDRAEALYEQTDIIAQEVQKTNDRLEASRVWTCKLIAKTLERVCHQNDIDIHELAKQLVETDREGI